MERVIDVYQSLLNKALSKEIEKSSFDLLFEDFMGYSNKFEIDFHRDDEMPAYDKLLENFNRMMNGEPVQYVLNKAYFYGNCFYVDNRVLIPRNETEELVDFALNLGLQNPVVYDICCGSGCVGISYKLNNPSSIVICSDISKDAIDVTKLNRDRLGADISTIQSDLLERFRIVSPADLILCNPPYISQGDFIDDLVWNNEPHLALVPPSGNGIEIYERLFNQLPRLMNDGCHLLFEIGENQKEQLTTLVKKYFKDSFFEFYKDINGKDRILYIQYNCGKK